MTKKTPILRRLFNFSPRECLFMLLGALGLFFGFPNPFIQLPLAALLFPFAVSLLALEAKSEGRAMRCVMGTVLLGGGLTVHWLVYPMINFGGVPLPLAIFFMLLLVAIISIYYIIYSMLLRFYRVKLPGPLPLLAGAFSWGALEYLRGWFLTGVTWCDLSTAMIGWPLFAQAAALFGSFGLSAVYALAALCFVPFFTREKLCHAGRGLPQAVLGVAIIAALGSYGAIRMENSFDTGEAVVVAQAQGNIGQAQKWLSSNRASTVRHYLHLSQKAIMSALHQYGQKPDLLVWPETAMPFHFQQPGELPRLIRDFARKEEIVLAFGVPAKRIELGESESYNRVWLLDKNGVDAGYYDKEHLVPFGEYIPKGLYVPFASEFLQGHGFTAGKMKAPMRSGKFLLGALICYESIFPELAQSRVAAGANFLLNVSNDAWFADSPAPWQHLQLAAMRSIEQGRYMIRSTNTGLSAMIDPAGRVQGLGPLFENYASAHRAYLLEDLTFFNRHFAAINAILAYSPFFFITLALLPGLKNNKKHPLFRK